MNIAVVGTGVSGLAAAWALDREHDVVLFEADARPGGHVHTHSVDDPVHGPLAVDSGFIVYNERNYRVSSGCSTSWASRRAQSDMSFAVTCRRCRLEYCGRGAAGLFAERRNMVRPSFLRLLADISRFFRAGKRALADPRWERRTIGDFLDEGSYGRGFERHFIAPMGAAIWSSSPDDMRSMPAAFFLGFFENHGLLGLREHCAGAPSTAARGGTSTPCSPASEEAAPGRAGARAAPERRRRRAAGGRRGRRALRPRDRRDAPERGARAARRPSDGERAALGRIRYSRNEAIVHTDSSMLPRTPRPAPPGTSRSTTAGSGAGGVAITYWMNRLQGLPGPTDYCVSLNGEARIDPRRCSHGRPTSTRSTRSTPCVRGTSCWRSTGRG